jgi:hypothetical protein
MAASRRRNLRQGAPPFAPEPPQPVPGTAGEAESPPPTPPRQQGWFDRLSAGSQIVAPARHQPDRLFTHRRLDQAMLDELEEC